jgi:Asp-tRNA(Asn)/Glu-tRNA(Gln) amidotransferase A subunit family amidase
LFVGSLDTIGPIGRTVRDLAASFDAMVGPDERDPVCYADTPKPAVAALDSGSSDLRIAKLGGYFARGGEPEVGAALAAVTEALGVTRELELPEPAIARAAAFIITATEGGELHRDRLAVRASDFDPSSRDRFIAGALAPSAWYLKAQRVRAWWRQEMLRLFEDVDVLIAPATPMVAPRIDQEHFDFDGEKLLLRPNIGIYTQPITLIGLPVVAAPVHASGHLPAGVQLIGKPYSEAVLLRVARELEARGVCSAPLGGDIAA